MSYRDPAPWPPCEECSGDPWRSYRRACEEPLCEDDMGPPGPCDSCDGDGLEIPWQVRVAEGRRGYAYQQQMFEKAGV